MYVVLIRNGQRLVPENHGVPAARHRQFQLTTTNNLEHRTNDKENITVVDGSTEKMQKVKKVLHVGNIKSRPEETKLT
jgi:hypothetical protein